MIDRFVVMSALDHALVVNGAVFREQDDPIWRHGFRSMEADLIDMLARPPMRVDDLSQRRCRALQEKRPKVVAAAALGHEGPVVSRSVDRPN